MENYVKMGIELGLPKDFMIHMDGERVLCSTFPTHVWKSKEKINGVHYKSAQIKTGNSS